MLPGTPYDLRENIENGAAVGGGKMEKRRGWRGRKKKRKRKGRKGESLSNLTHGSVFTKQHVCGHVDTKVEDIHVVLDGHLQLSERRHLRDQTSRADGEECGGSAVGHQWRVDS